jgi:Ca-activated chloride channel homolog
MDKDVEVALIGASGVVAAALIGLVATLLSARPRRDNVPDRAGRGAEPRESRVGLLRPLAAAVGRRRTVVAVSLVTTAVLALAMLVVLVVSQPRTCGTFAPVVVNSSTEKDEVLTALAETYSRRPKPVNGVCATITVEKNNSGDAERALVEGWGTDRTQGRTFPDVWLPTSSMWVKLYQAQSHRDPDLPTPSITRSPLVIALPKSIAKAMDWPNATLSWKQLQTMVMATGSLHNPGLPAGQPFVLNKDNPKYSTSGLASLVAEYYAASRQTNHDLAGSIAGRKGDPSGINDITNYVRSLETGAKLSHDVFDVLRDQGQRDMDGVPLKDFGGIVMEEQLVYLYNSMHSKVFQFGKPSSLREPLYIFYPSDGILDMDHPYVVLSHDANVRNAAESFRRFLIEEPQQKTFMQWGFRHVATNQLSADAGRVMNASEAALPSYWEQPSSDVLTYIHSGIDDFLARRARVLLVLDVSGSMKDPGTEAKTKIELMKDAVVAALSMLNPNDEVGLGVFADAYRYIQKIAPLATTRQQLVDEIRNPRLVYAGGNTALYATTRAAFDRMNKIPTSTDWVNAIVLLTDGHDNLSADKKNKNAENEALERLKADLSGAERKVPIYTIGFGISKSPLDKCDVNGVKANSDDPDYDLVAIQALAGIAEASGGSCYNAARDQASYINDVFVHVFQHF